MKTVVKAFRVDPELWSYIEERAAAVGVKPASAWLLKMAALHRAGRLEVKALPTDYPLKPVLPDQPKRAPVIQVGPARQAPGSRLKKR